MSESKRTFVYFFIFSFGIIIGSLNFWFYADQLQFARMRKKSMESLRVKQEVKLRHRRKERDQENFLGYTSIKFFNLKLFLFIIFKTAQSLLKK